MSSPGDTVSTWSRPALLLAGFLLVAAAGALGWRLGAGSPERAGSANGAGDSDERALPTHLLTALDGSEISLSEYSGRVLVVDFWASWCGPCRFQAEILAKLHGRYAAAGVEFVAVNLGEDRATVERYVDGHPFPYPVLMDPAEQLGVELGIIALPTVLVADPAGRITYLRPGISDRPTLERELAAIGAEAVEKPT